MTCTAEKPCTDCSAGIRWRIKGENQRRGRTLALHDNVEDARWIENNLTEIARNLVLSLTDYFGIPFIWPTDPWEGTVHVNGGTLNLRSRPR